MTRFLLACLAALLISGCGFHLRNSLTLPADLGPVQVTAPDPYSPLLVALEQALERNGATVVEAGSGAAAGNDTALLQVTTERWGDTPIAIDAQGRAQEFSLRYAVVFTLARAGGQVLVPPQTLELSRDYVAPPVDGIGTTSERELLAREMRRDMVASILRRIDAVSKAPAPAAAETSSP